MLSGVHASDHHTPSLKAWSPVTAVIAHVLNGQDCPDGMQTLRRGMLAGNLTTGLALLAQLLTCDGVMLTCTNAMPVTCPLADA